MTLLRLPLQTTVYPLTRVNTVNEKHSESANLRQGSCDPNPNVMWSRSPPKSNQFLLITRRTLPKISSKFLNNFLSYPTDRQTDRRRVKHILLGCGNRNLAFVPVTIVRPRRPTSGQRSKERNPRPRTHFPIIYPRRGIPRGRSLCCEFGDPNFKRVLHFVVSRLSFNFNHWSFLKQS